MSDPSPGSRLGKYEIRAVLGKGAMGTVYDGMDPVIDRRVAIKTVRLPDTGDAEAQDGLARFKREAQAAGRLNHPNIVGIFDYGETDALAYIVMEFVDGRSLKDILEGGERLPLAETLRIMADILAGLSYSHARGVVHRDIKPANIMITGRDHRAKIADFGIARIESSSMTQAGTVLGTPAYMSPEQFMGQTVDRRSDIYSTGVLLYQLLTGERPFEGGLTAIMHKVLNTTPPSPSELSVTAPPGLDAVVARAMARRPEDRFTDADSFAAAIGRGTQETSAQDSDATLVVPPPTPAPAPAPAAKPTDSRLAKRSPSPALLGAGAAALLVVAGIGAWVLIPSAAPPTPPSGQPNARTGGSTTTTMTQSGQGPVQLPDTPSNPPAPNTPPNSTPDTRQPGSQQPNLQTSPANPAQTPVDPRYAVVNDAQPTNPPRQKPPLADPNTTATPQPLTPLPPTPTPPKDQPSQQTTVLANNNTVLPPTSPPADTSTSQSPQTPPATPPTPPPAARAPSAIRAALAASLPTLRCTMATAAVSDDGVATVTGVAGTGDPASLRRAVALADPASTRWDVTTIDDQYCHTLDILRPAANRPGPGTRPLQMAFTDGQRELHDNNAILLTATMPEFAGHLQIDYVQHDGTVNHMVPAGGYPDRTYAAGSRTEFGRPRPDFEGWLVSGPSYGTELIVAIASTAPVFARARADGETVETYLRDLQAGMDALRRRGGSVATSALVIVTSP